MIPACGVFFFELKSRGVLFGVLNIIFFKALLLLWLLFLLLVLLNATLGVAKLRNSFFFNI